MKTFLSVLIVISVLLLLILPGCRTAKYSAYKYYNDGCIQEAIYSDLDEFHFFSDGDGKTIEIAPTVNGIGL